MAAKTNFTIEENLERIADAVEAFTKSFKIEALPGATTAEAPVTAPAAPAAPAATDKKATRKPRAAAPEAPPAPPTPAAPAEPASAAPAAPAEPAADAVTRDQVREALRTFRQTHSKDEALATLRKHGANSVSDAPEEALAALLADFSK